MNPIITEQLNKFKNGDFGGYESFYNETVSTVYTMLHTVVHDSNVATSLVPQVYDKIYQNVTSLEQTNGFYQWAAELANEEALGYLKENGWTEIHNDSVENTYEQAVDGKFYDYAVEDEALTITEDAVLDTSFVTRVQEIVTTLSPMDRVVFQDYYYFGVSVPEIAVKTGCKDSDIRYTLSQTRTAILQTIALAPVDDSENGNSNIRRYRLAEVPWMWIAYQNFLAYTLGIDTISIAGWLADIFGQIVGSGIAVSGMDAEGTATGAVSMVRSQLELVCPREKQRVQRLEVSELLVRVEVWQQSLVQLVENCNRYRWDCNGSSNRRWCASRCDRKSVDYRKDGCVDNGRCFRKRNYYEVYFL